MTQTFVEYIQGGSNMTGTMCVNNSQFVPVIFEPPCTFTLLHKDSSIILSYSGEDAWKSAFFTLIIKQADQQPKHSTRCSVLSLCAFPKLRKVTISFAMSTCPSVRLSVHHSVSPSVRMEQLGFRWTEFDHTWYLSLFSKIRRENSSFIKTRQKWRILYIKMFPHLW